VKRKNKYARRSRISEKKFRQLIKFFSLDLDATRTSEICNTNRNTVNRHFNLFRSRIARLCEKTSPFTGTVEIDESYFGPKRVKGKRGRGASNKTKVFGILKRGGKIYTEIVPDCKSKTLQDIIRGKINPESVVNSDGWRAYDGLVDIGYSKHYRVIHSKDEFARGSSHINGIESFWSYAKRRLQKFQGVVKHTFYLHLKETEYRFNLRKFDLYSILLKEFRERPLN